MKNTLHTFIHAVQNKEKKALISAGLLSFGIVAASLPFFLYEQPTDELALMNSSPESVEVGVVGEEEMSIHGASTNSWPGEIVSSEVSQVQPQREGTITEWRINIGQTVQAGQILGKISAPPATPELIQMLAEQKEALTRAQAQSVATEAYVLKEKERLTALRATLETGNTSDDSTFQSLARLREMTETEKKALRIFVEQSLNSQITAVSNAVSWRSFRVGMMDKDFGTLDQSLQHTYETTLAAFVEELKNSPDVRIDSARNYYGLAARIANATVNGEKTSEFKTMARADQVELSEKIANYQKAVAELADKESEYKIMISEKSSDLERERAMATAEASASEASYATVAGQINGSLYITAPRTGTVSTITKKVGDLVSPEMAIAVISGSGNKNTIIRIRVPGNIKKPNVGDELSVVRPGFPADIHKAKLIGIGSSLDETGSYMADAKMVDSVTWPINASIRVFGTKEHQTVTVPSSAIFWDESGSPRIWAISPADRVFLKNITVGRTVGDMTEVYAGLSLGDRYLKTVPDDIREDMFLDEIIKKEEPAPTANPSESSGQTDHEGHNMEGM